jgi:glycosyltransferase involved in cell wall biosynthesis
MLYTFASQFFPDRRAPVQTIMGAQIGTTEFLKAIIKYSPVFPVAFIDSDIDRLKNHLHRISENEMVDMARWRACEVRDCPALMQAHLPFAFHDASGPFLHHMAYLRAHFATSNFPITCLVHGFSYQAVIWDVFMRISLTPVLPCDSILCTSLAAREAFANILARTREEIPDFAAVSPRMDIIPLGVDTETFMPREKADMRSLLGLPQEKIILLYFGRIDTSSKADQNPLLMVFKELTLKYSTDITLVLAGNTEPRSVNLLERMAETLGIEKQVIIRAHPTLTEGPLYYSAADIFVSPVETLQESFGISPLEAMSSSLPAVVSDWSGYQDTVLHGQTGFRIKTLWAN